MRSYTKVWLCLLGGVLLGSCTTNSYSDELDKEEKLINSFISRNNITVVDTEPEEWGEKVYWRVPGYDNLFFHLVSRGDTTTEAIVTGETVLLRYRRYTLDAYADTTSYWNTLDSPYPTEVQYMTSTTNSCTGWHIAIQYMKYAGAESKIICPDKLDLDDGATAVIPYGYDLKITGVKRF